MLSGCGSDQRGESKGPADPTATVSLPPGTSEPFELLNVGQFDRLSDLIGQYETNCARGQGVDVPDVPSSSIATGFIVSREDFGYRTEDQARQRGLHPGPAQAAAAPPKPTAAQAQTLTKCLDQAQSLLGPNYKKVTDSFFAVYNNMVSEYQTAMAPKIEEADARVEKCVVDDGWQPALPDKVGSEDVSAAEVFGVTMGKSTTNQQTGVTTYTPSAREVDLALALLHCRLKLRTPDELLAAAKAIQAPVAAKYEQQIRQEDTDLEALVRKATSVLR